MSVVDDKIHCHRCGVEQIPPVSRSGEYCKIVRDAAQGGKGSDQHLSLRYSQQERDLQIWSPCQPDGHLFSSLLSGCFGFTQFLAELVDRGYDLSTLEFTVRRKPKDKP